MKTMVFAAFALVASAALADLDTLSLDGTWDFAFARGAKLEQGRADFEATDKIVVPGCFDLMPKWYAQRGLAHYRRTFTLEKPALNAFLKVKGFGLQSQ